jgi:polyisoprenoid-binding protein YceI
MAAVKDPAAAPAGVYEMDLLHQSVIARVLHGGTSYSTLRFGVTKGELVWDPKNPAGISLSVTVDAMPHTDPIVYKFKPESPMMLNVAKFPVATFVSTAVKQTGPATADVEGNLTLMGVTKPEVIHAELVGAGHSVTDGSPEVGFTGVMVIQWADFTKPFMPGKNEVTLLLDGAFEKH